MSNQIEYLNTDLDLASSSDLTALSEHLEANGVFSLHVTQGGDGEWSATFETDEIHNEPETNIAALLDVIENLDETHRTTWSRCTQREFNIGYDCGHEPWAFNHGLSNALIRRIADVGASVRFTIYPRRDQENAR